MTRRQLAVDISTLEGSTGIASAQVVVEALQKTPLLISWVSVSFLNTGQRKRGEPRTSMESVLPGYLCGWPTGLSEQQGDAALLCGCRLAVGLVKVLGSLISHFELPWPLLTCAHAEVWRAGGLEFFKCFIGFFMAWIPSKRNLKVAILAWRTLWVYLTERSSSYTQSYWNKNGGFVFEGIHYLEPGIGQGGGYEA